MLKVSQVLEQAWSLLQQRGRWTRGALARNALLQDVNPASKYADCFCSLGAIDRVAYLNNVPGLIHLADSHLRLGAAGVFGVGADVASINDDADRIEDLAPMWELAIKLAKKKEENA